MCEMWELDRAPVGDRRYASGRRLLDPSTSDLHAWSIFRQNLNSDFTDSALGAEERSPLPYGNFTLKEETVQSIMSNPRLGPRSELASNAFSYLKFGLPRVLPPSASAKDGSRDSSGDEDDERMRPRHPGQGPGQRARSETDIRSDGVVMNRFRRKGHSQPHGGMRQAISEGNILSASKQGGPPWMGKASNGHGQIFQKSSHVGSGNQEPGAGLPHLQVGRLCVRDGKGEGLLVDHVSFELRCGEMLALMPTNGIEGTALLEALAGERPLAGGDIVLNGNVINGQRLGRRLGFLRKGVVLHPELNPGETLRFFAAFKRTGKHPPSSNKVEALLDFLGLSGVGRSLVSSLTSGERQRLAVGCQMIMETQILLLDSPTSSMDIFDTFFLMSLVEEWTRVGGWNGGGGVAIVTIHPPTFEVFSTFTKVLLLSGGRTLFYGHRTELLPYFAFIDYPCPPFKNPSDYYIDLVTRDDLSNEALQESSMRIHGLAEAWARRQESPSMESSPPQTMPPPLRRPQGAILGEILLLWRCLGFSGIGSRLITWFLLFLAAASISVLMGVIYWDTRLGVPAHVNSAYDRLGLHWASLTLLPNALFLLILAKDRRENSALQSDIREGLYSRAAHFLAQRIGEFVPLVSLLAVLVVPGMAMGGVRDVDGLLLSAVYSTLCLYTMLTGLRALDLLCRRSTAGLTVGAILVLTLSLTGGYVTHRKDLGEWVAWTEVLSPVSWLLPPMARIEFRNSTFEICSNPIVQLRGNLLMRELSCGLGRGESVLSHFDLPSKPLFLPLLVCLGFILVSDLVALLVHITGNKVTEVTPTHKP